MKWNRWIIKAAKIITKFTELGYWMMAALMLTAGIYSFADRTFLADALAGSIRTGRLELSVLGFEFSVPTANGIDMRAMLLYFAAAVVLPSLMAMIFRNLYLIIKRSESSTVFQADNIRMLREIGIFAISIPLAGLALSTVCRLILGTDTVETSVRLYGFSMGLVILCLTQFFARGVELEQDVEGLVNGKDHSETGPHDGRAKNVAEQAGRARRHLQRESVQDQEQQGDGDPLLHARGDL